MKKLDKYGIRGVTNKWFESYLSNRVQYVSNYGKRSQIKAILHGVPQGSVLGPLLFIIYINDLYNAILYSKTSLFADDTCFLYSDSLLKRLEKRINIDLKRLYKWLCANKISLNVAKTEVVLFRNVHKKINYDVKLKLSGKILYFSKQVKYLGITVDEFLSWADHTKELSNKLRNANGVISKMRYLVPKSTLFSIYNALFLSHLNYACQIWAQNLNPNTNRILKLQKCSIRLLSFANFNAHTTPYFLQHNILKLPDLVKKRNIVLTHHSLNNECPIEITKTFNLNYHPENYNTRGRSMHLLTRPRCRTTKYGLNSITYQSIIHWNELQLHHSDINLASVSVSKINQLTSKFLLSQYLT